MKVKILKDRRDFKAGTVAELPAGTAAKFIRQGFAEVTAKPKAAKKAKAKATRKKTT